MANGKSAHPVPFNSLYFD